MSISRYGIRVLKHILISSQLAAALGHKPQRVETSSIDLQEQDKGSSVHSSSRSVTYGVHGLPQPGPPPGLFLTPPNSSPEPSVLRMQEHRAAMGNFTVDHGPPVRQLTLNSVVSGEVSLSLYHQKDHDVTLPLGPQLSETCA